MKSNNEVQNENEGVKVMINNNFSKLTFKNLKNSISKFYSNKKKNNQIIENIYNFFSRNNDESKYIIFFEYKNMIKFKKRINYINNLFFNYEKKSNNYRYNLKEKCSLNNYWFVIDNIFVLKNFIDVKKHLLLKNFFKILLLLQHFDIISLNIFKLIFEIYISIIIDLVVINNSNISFLNDLIEGLADFLKGNEAKDNNLLYSIISIFEEYISNNYRLKYEFKKALIYLKFLNYKSVIEGKIENNERIINFLSDIYKNNITINILFEEIYRYGILDLNYYSNSLKLLSNILNIESSDRQDNLNFKIKKGFFIHKDCPIILEKKINFNEKESSIIFSFKLLNESKNDDKDSDIIIFNFSDCSIKDKEKIYFSFNLSKINDNYFIKILNDNNEWIINDISILKGYDYLICISKSDKNINVYINKVNIKKDNKIITAKKILHDKIVNQFPFKNVDNVELKFVRKNFEGIFGDFFMIDKKLNDTDFSNLLNLNSYYSYIIDNKDDKLDLINDLNNSNINKKDSIYFNQLDFKCIFKLIPDKINLNYIPHINKDEGKRETFILDNTLNIFINGNGVEYLVLQMHNLFCNLNRNDITPDEKNQFNLFLYQTIKFYYDIIQIINNGDKKNFRINHIEKFDYFLLSLLIILDYYKKVNKYLNMSLEIYNLLLDFASFCNNNKYFVERDLILNILLDENIFNQNIIIKEYKIFENLKCILSHFDNKNKELFGDEILLKILNFQFILESKEYNHKLYIEIILELILTNKENIVEKIFKYIINIKREAVL